LSGNRNRLGPAGWADERTGDAVADINGNQLTHALGGMPYPARRWQTVTWAEYNCASEEVLEALRYLPNKIYSSIYEIMDALQK
jgi:hypothetical protein